MADVKSGLDCRMGAKLGRDSGCQNRPRDSWYQSVDGIKTKTRCSVVELRKEMAGGKAVLTEKVAASKALVGIYRRRNQ